MFLVSFLEKQPAMPILKNEIKCLPPLPPLSKSSTVLHTFNSTILTPVSNNNSGFLRNLLNSSTGKVCICLTVYTLLRPPPPSIKMNRVRVEDSRETKIESRRKDVSPLLSSFMDTKAVSLADGLHGF